MRIVRAAAAVAVVAVLVGVWAGAASAHVTVSPSTAEQGSYAVLTFRVPNERPSTATTKLQVKLPDDTPFTFAAVQPVPGWSATVEKAPLATPITSHGETVTEAPSIITWSGGRIAPGEFQEFSIQVGPLPEVGSLTFPTIQTYDDGEEVAWIQVAEAGQPEPERPAPELTLTDASGSSDAHDEAATPASTTTTASAADEAAAAPATGSTGSDGDSGQGLAVAALVVAIIAAVLAGVALVVRRPRAGT
jgi:uncharacterized protein